MRIENNFNQDVHYVLVKYWHPSLFRVIGWGYSFVDSHGQDLHHDAMRDMRALGCHINIINNCQTLDRETRVSGLAKDMQEGVLFM